MINRILLRIKVIQILYAYYKGEDQQFEKAERELKESVSKTYDLYFYLLQLIPALTELAKDRAATNRTDIPQASKKFINNKVAKIIAENKQICDYLEEHDLSWENKRGTVLRLLLDDILSFDLYEKYNENQSDNDLEEDKDLWKKIFRQVIASSEILGKQLEEESIYWNADEETVHSFVVKTLKSLTEDSDSINIQPMFRDEEDQIFMNTLLRNAIYKSEEYNSIINSHVDTKRWEIERIAFMDKIIMQTALAEILSFPTIPVNVSLNEYIEIAKSYSTDKSGTFINGILDAAIAELRENKKLTKVAYYNGK